MTIPAVLLSLGGLALALASRHEPGMRILRISRVVADLERSETFYRNALGFTTQGRRSCDPAVAALFGVATGTASETIMQLGAEEIALVRFDAPGTAHPTGGGSDDLWFQHLAIVVDDMDAAYGRVMAHAPQQVSTAGPEILPGENGGTFAFKFRDPDGHPLELIRFPPGQGRPVWRVRSGGPFLGIEHTAISVTSTAPEPSRCAAEQMDERLRCSYSETVSLAVAWVRRGKGTGIIVLMQARQQRGRTS